MCGENPEFYVVNLARFSERLRWCRLLLYCACVWSFIGVSSYLVLVVCLLHKKLLGKDKLLLNTSYCWLSWCSSL